MISQDRNSTTAAPAPARAVQGPEGDGPSVAAAVAASRTAQAAWAEVPLRQRAQLMRRLRRRLVDELDGLVHAVEAARTPRAARAPGETVSSEVLPLIEACVFLARRGATVLRSRGLGWRGRPGWLMGVRGEVRRVPWGVVLIIGPGNYPLLLPGVQALQALMAGNAVAVKPGAESAAAMQVLARLLEDAGLPAGAFVVLAESAAAAEAAIEAGVDHVVLTGSSATGRSVLRRAAATLTPVTAELSGCDAMIVRADADLKLVADAAVFGLRLNGGATCIAPRRVLVDRRVAEALAGALRERMQALPPAPVPAAVREQLATLLADAERQGAQRLAGGIEGEGVRPVLLGHASPTMALLQADVFAPVLAMVCVDGDEAALAADAACPYALGASIFGDPEASRRLAHRLRAGSVTINDVIVPTADPRVPFGGSGESGFGVTRGAEGLLAMTRPQTILVRRGRFRPHLRPPRAGDESTLRALTRLIHGRSAQRWCALRDLLRLRRSQP